MHFHITCFFFSQPLFFFSQESDTDTEPYDDEEFEGYEDKSETGSPSKNKDPITIVDVRITTPILYICCG